MVKTVKDEVTKWLQTYKLCMIILAGFVALQSILAWAYKFHYNLPEDQIWATCMICIGSGICAWEIRWLFMAEYKTSYLMNDRPSTIYKKVGKIAPFVFFGALCYAMKFGIIDYNIAQWANAFLCFACGYIFYRLLYEE